jgi:hypothetical protein
VFIVCQKGKIIISYVCNLPSLCRKMRRLLVFFIYIYTAKFHRLDCAIKIKKMILKLFHVIVYNHVTAGMYDCVYLLTLFIIREAKN